ncbi:hypothetical protein NDU88_009589 [Pleurodeles waltl]|uniref:Uncharacterized protein n=1 Tax=Pleurodeles waltl TaxID=8319 RepID=A0AAV7RYS8_PLEWA|nr:hypothetical protein NDU88_009589 [Pleurodeles waltl]
MEGQNPFSEISGNKDFGAFINEAMTKAMAATMSKMSKSIESSVQNMFFKSFMAHSAGDSRKRKNKDLSRQNDGALLTGDVSSPMTEDEMPPGPPSQEGNSDQVSGNRKSITKNTLAAPKQVIISHISDTDDDVGDMDDLDNDSDVWGSLSQPSPPKKPILEVSTPFSAKIVLDSEGHEQGYSVCSSVELLQAYVRCPSRHCLHPRSCCSAAQHFSFRFSRAPGLNFPLLGLDSAARLGSSPPWWAALAALLLRWTSDLTPGPPLSILAGPEHLPPRLARPVVSRTAPGRAQQLWSLVTGWGAMPLLPRSCFTSSEHPWVLKAACPAPRQVRCSTPAAVTAVLRCGTAPSVFASPGLLGSVSLYQASAVPRAGILLSFLTSC